MLSADLATLFTGRYIEIHVFPFSFSEYCRYYEETKDIDQLFEDYTIKGGLAGSYAYKTEKDRINYIKEVYETIVTRDLVQKYALPDTLVLQRLSEFLMDNVSNLTSPNKVSQLLTASNTQTNHVTVGKYIRYLCNAFVFYDIKRYDIRGRKYLESSEKFYLCDTGIRYAILGSRNMDYGRMYENMVCIELLRRGYDVYVGKLYQKEIDFVVQKGDEKSLYSGKRQYCSAGHFRARMPSPFANPGCISQNNSGLEPDTPSTVTRESTFTMLPIGYCRNDLYTTHSMAQPIDSSAVPFVCLNDEHITVYQCE